MLRLKKRKKRRRQRILLAVLAAAAVILLLILIRVSGKPKAVTEGSLPESKEAAGEKESSGQETSDASEPPEETLTLTEAMVHTGDLILVNWDHAYDFAANENDIDLVNIRENQSFYYQVEKTDMMLSRHIMASLDSLIAGCDEAVGNQETGISSAYRSYDYQQNVRNEILETYGQSYTEAHVADPGYSEHHTGLSLDLGIFYEDGSEGTFSESENARWMKDNSWKYGFIRRYAEDKTDITGISNEAWHFRYVGLPHASYMYEQNLCLEEYLAYLENNTSEEAPLTVTAENGTWKIWYTEAKTIKKPEGPYTVSGNNSGGYLITEEVTA